MPCFKKFWHAVVFLIVFQPQLWTDARMAEQPKHNLVELIKLDPTLRLDIRYATKNNFAGKVVYSEARAFLQRPVAEAVVRAHQALQKKGYGLTIFDGYRPLSVVKIFWDVTSEENKIFVADPAKGSVHARGCAVDLTLHDLKTSQEVQMPSEFDEWSERSHSEYKGGSEESRRLRKILRTAMEAEGFIQCEHEWWHYTHPDWEKCPNLDLKFSEILTDDSTKLFLKNPKVH